MSIETDTLVEICKKRIDSEGLSDDKRYVQRLDIEQRDLVNWEKYSGRNVAAEILKEIGKNVPPMSSNRSGSLILFLSGLSSIDPIVGNISIKTQIISQGSPPDIDVDFDPRIRDWVKEKIVEIFGAEHVCSIGTYQTYRTRAVILDVARALGKDVHVANEVTKVIDPLESFEDEESETKEEKKADKLSFDELCRHYPELKTYFEQNPEVRRHAEILRNQVKNMGTHAGGVIISDINLIDKMPVLFDKPSSDERKVISAWAEAGGNEELTTIGLVKFDILGLNNLPIVSDCIRLIEENQGKRITKADIPIDDRLSIDMGSKKDLVGIFQLDNPSTKQVADQVQMESLNDIAAVTSLIRPGPRDMGMHIEYAKRKHGSSYEMPEILREILADTYGVIVFQEQIMKVAQKLAGFTPTESYKLLKIFAKKLPDQFPAFRKKFIDGAQPMIEQGVVTAEDVESISDQLAKFANYGFNRSVDICSSVWCNGAQEEAGKVVPGDIVLCFDGINMVETEVVANHDHGTLPAFEVEFENGEKVVCSIFHKFETPFGKKPLWDLLINKQGVYCADYEKMGMQNMRRGVPFGKAFAFASQRNKTLYQTTIQDSKMCWMRNNHYGDEECLQAPVSMSRSSPYCKYEQGDCESQEGFRFTGNTHEGSNEEEDISSIEKDNDATTSEKTSFRKHEEIECGPDIQSKDEASIVCCSTDNINASRYYRIPFCYSKKVAKGTSRSISGNIGKDEEGNQEVKSRNLVVGEHIEPECIQKKGSSSLCKHGQRSGFCEQECVDRGGWLLALWNRFYEKKIFLSTSSRERCSTQQGSRTQGHDVDSIGSGLLARQRSLQVEERMDWFSEEYDSESEAGSISLRKMLSARFVGFRKMCDLEVSHSSHNFAFANGIITSNSHAVEYSALSAAELWLRCNYQLEYITSLINNTRLGKKKHGSEIFVDYINYARRNGIEVLCPDISRSKTSFVIEQGKIRFSLSHISFVASMAEVIQSFQPFVGMEDFHNRVKIKAVNAKTGKESFRRPNKRVVETLIEAGAFDAFGPRNEMMVEYYKLRAGKKEEPPQHSEMKWRKLETEAIGLCLSEPILCREYEAVILEKKLKLISEIGDLKTPIIFGRIESIVPKISKSGNAQYLVKATDGIDTITFYVFMSGMQYFDDHFKVGTIGGIPLNKFDEGDTRFFNIKKQLDIIKEGDSVC